MLLNLSTRTDIPAFFSQWFYNRIKEGFVCVRNPYFPEKVSRYLLTPALVDCLLFCTKNPGPMLKDLSLIEEFGQFWAVTITPYAKEIEPHVPDKNLVIDNFIQLSKSLNSSKVRWRYDPIFFTDVYTPEYHLKSFDQIANRLSGYTDTCVISFLNLYEKTKKNFSLAREVSLSDQHALSSEIVKIGSKYGITIYACAETPELSIHGINCSGCMTKEVVEDALDIKLKVPKTKGARSECDCLIGADIGVYNTCAHGCTYCYANYSRELVKQNLKMHDVKSPFLIGNYQANDVIHDVKQKTFKLKFV